VLFALGIGKYVAEVKLPGFISFVASAVAILAAATIASALPGARAARVNAVEALRADNCGQAPDRLSKYRTGASKGDRALQDCALPRERAVTTERKPMLNARRTHNARVPFVSPIGLPIVKRTEHHDPLTHRFESN
jgi:hypothetical protein